MVAGCFVNSLILTLRLFLVFSIALDFSWAWETFFIAAVGPFCYEMVPKNLPWLSGKMFPSHAPMRVFPCDG